MLNINPQPCINCEEQFRCSEVVDSKCISYTGESECSNIQNTSLENVIEDIYSKICLSNKFVIFEDQPNVPGGQVYTHNFNLNNPKTIIIQVLDLTTNISTGAILTDFTSNTVKIDTNTVNNCDIKLSI